MKGRLHWVLAMLGRNSTEFPADDCVTCSISSNFHVSNWMCPTTQWPNTRDPMCTNFQILPPVLSLHLAHSRQFSNFSLWTGHIGRSRTKMFPSNFLASLRRNRCNKIQRTPLDHQKIHTQSHSIHRILSKTPKKLLSTSFQQLIDLHLLHKLNSLRWGESALYSLHETAILVKKKTNIPLEVKVNVNSKFHRFLNELITSNGTFELRFDHISRMRKRQQNERNENWINEMKWRRHEEITSQNGHYKWRLSAYLIRNSLKLLQICNQLTRALVLQNNHLLVVWMERSVPKDISERSVFPCIVR